MATERVVIDASAGVRASLTAGWQALGNVHLVAPTLFWSEVASGIRQLEYRREISADEAVGAVTQLLAANVEPYPSRELARDAQELARRLGWAKTYDAEFVALARRLDVRLLTVDQRLAATAARLVEIFPSSDGRGASAATAASRSRMSWR